MYSIQRVLEEIGYFSGKVGKAVVETEVTALVVCLLVYICVLLTNNLLIMQIMTSSFGEAKAAVASSFFFKITAFETSTSIQIKFN